MSSTSSERYQPGMHWKIKKDTSLNKNAPNMQTKEVSIKELQKQQEELIRMQQMIQKQMATIQNAIWIQEQDKSRWIRSRKGHYDHEKQPEIQNKNSKIVKTKDRSPIAKPRYYNNGSFVSVNDYNNNYMTASSQIDRSKKEKNEKSVPLFNNEKRCNSALKKRRTRWEREREMSADKYASNANQSKSPALANLKPTYENVYFNNNIPQFLPGSNNGKSRTAFCSRDHSFYNDNTSVNHKASQIEKTAGLLNKKVFDVLRRTRPTQSTIKAVRMFFKLLKHFGKHYRHFDENETWNVLTNTLAANSNLIMHEISISIEKIESLEAMPDIFDEINSQLFAKKPKKGVPSCSTAFQKEVKPITNFLQSVVNHFDMKDKSWDIGSNSSGQKSWNKASVMTQKNSQPIQSKPKSKVLNNTSQLNVNVKNQKLTNPNPK